MATVTGMTAARMLAIEAASVTDADLSSTGELTFTTHGGTVISVGNVRAPMNTPEKPSTAAPSAYPYGTSQFAYSTQGGWPTATGTVFTVMESVARGFQLVSERASASGGTMRIWMRTVYQDNWSAFYQIADKSYVDAADTALGARIDANSYRMDYLDGLVKGLELAGGVDLNTMTSPGHWTQSQNVEASSGSNYPVPLAGALEVASNGTDQTWQTYTPYSTFAMNVYRRSLYLGVWSPWYKYSSVPPDPQTSSVNATVAITATAAGTLVPGLAALTLVLAADCWVDLRMQAWMQTGTVETRAGIAMTGANTAVMGNIFTPSSGLYLVNGDLSVATASVHRQSSNVVKLNAGTTSIRGEAYRSGTGTASVNYPIIQAIPLRWA